MEIIIKTIAIPYDSKLPPHEEKNVSEHKEGLFKVIRYYNDHYGLGIELPPYYSVDAYELARTIAPLGFIILFHVESKKYETVKDLAAIIPTQISKGQKDYFEEKNEFLETVNLMLELENEKNWKQVDKSTTKAPIINILYDELNKRLVIERPLIKEKKIDE